jgi:photosystem II stability/assembly factor-like uncharacterized protein
MVVGWRNANPLGDAGVPEGAGVAFKTMDGGATWKLLSLPREAAELQSVDCVSSQRCVITSWTDFGVKRITQQEDFSLTTEDGGGKWFVTKINRDVDGDPVSLSCPAASVCYVATWGSVLKSTNDGRSWKRVFISDGYNTGIACYSEQICEMVSLNRSYRTNNGGRFWQQQAHFPRGEGPSYLACPDRYHCIATGAKGDGPTYKDRGRIFVTDNAGRSWRIFGYPALSYAAGPVSCASPSFCVVFGAIGVAWITNVEGTHWTHTNLSGGLSNSASCVVPDICEAASENNAFYPAVYGTDDGIHWTEQPVAGLG